MPGARSLPSPDKLPADEATLFTGLPPDLLWRTMAADATGEPLMIDGQRFVIVDLRIPFLRLVIFFFKAALAAIPAAIVVGFLLMLATALVAATLGDHGFATRHWTF